MEHKKYEKPELEILAFPLDDIICTSGLTNNGNLDGWETDDSVDFGEIL